MENQISMYQKQYDNALQTIERLREVKSCIDFKLKSNPVCSYLHQDLRLVNLDITITLNEIEHIESHLYESVV
jgi:hypothetical protein